MVITEVKYLGGYKLQLTFHNDKVKMVDFTDFLFDYANTNFHKYRDLNKFKKVRIEDGWLAWGKNEVDLSGEYMYNWEKNEKRENKRRKEKIIAEFEM
jgi:hypothetical protein